MAPITYSKNQFDVLDGNTSSNSSNIKNNANDTSAAAAAPTTSFEELTNDLMMMDDDEDGGDDIVTDDLMVSTQGELIVNDNDEEWEFDDLGVDTLIQQGQQQQQSNKASSQSDEDEDLHMADDSSDDDESSDDDLEEDNPTPSKGRTKRSIAAVKETVVDDDHVAPTDAAPADVDDTNDILEDDEAESHADVAADVEENTAKSNEQNGDNDSHDDSDDGSEDEDDNTVAMSENEDEDDEDGAAAEETVESKDDGPKESFSFVDNDAAGEDSDAWLDGSDEEGKKWREKEVEQSEDEEQDSDDEEQELDVSKDSAATNINGGDDVTKEREVETPRRSVRARKPRKSDSNDSDAAASKPKKKRVPAKQVWEAALDQMYADLEDKSSVTINQMKSELSQKFNCIMSKTWARAIKKRLSDLVNERTEPADSGEEEEDADDEASVATDPGQDVSDYEDNAKSSKARRKAKRARAKKGKTSRRKSLRDSQRSERKAARAAKMLEMQKLRRKQLMEEKVRNEEMQLNQTKEDHERAEAIAAKFETNTDELRLKRLEDRLDLLQQLDQKRISVIEIKDDTHVKKEPVIKLEPVEATAKEPQKQELETEESSSEEEDLVIVGAKKAMKPLKPLQNHAPSSALDILNGIRSPEAKKYRARQSKGLSFAPGSKRVGMITSPGKSMGARFALRNALRQKQRKVGNLWLARELGYKREEDHIKDCMTVADQKRGLVLKLEQERLKANERKNLRERLLLQEANAYEESKDEVNDTEDPEAAEEEDEELQMAKELEQENQEKENDALEVAEGPHGEIPENDGLAESQERESTGEEDYSRDLETQPPETTTNSLVTSRVDCPQENPPSSSPDGNPVEEELSKDCLGHADTPQAFVETYSPQMGEPQDLESQLLETQPPSVPMAHENGEVIQDNESTALQTADESVVMPDREVQKDVATTDNESGLNGEETSADLEDDETEKGGDGRELETKPKNSLWQEALRREAEKLKKQRKRKGGLVEEEAEEEEEEEVAGLEDFGFTTSKKKKDDDDEDIVDDELDEEDLKHVVDDVSDNEGDEEAGMAARRRMEAQEEKRRHKEFMRRTREGHDGRRGGIAGGSGARGLHGFDQLVAPDNREDAKRLGLLNDDELDSEDEQEKDTQVDEEDETALLDQNIRRRHLLQSDVNVEDEYFSSDEEDELQIGDDANASDVEEEIAQRRLNKLFKKRATMKDYERLYGDNEEFSQQRLIDEDTSMKEELKKMRNGLVRRRSISSSLSQSSQSSNNTSQHAFFGPAQKRQRGNSGSIANRTGGSLSVALLASRTTVRKTSFLGGSRASSCSSIKENSQTISSGRFAFNSHSNSRSGLGSSSNVEGEKGGTKRKFGRQHTTTLFSRVVGR